MCNGSPSRFLPSEDSTDTHTLPNCLPALLQGGSKISTEDALSLTKYKDYYPKYYDQLLLLLTQKDIDLKKYLGLALEILANKNLLLNNRTG